jgi:hypothetical protein
MMKREDKECHESVNLNPNMSIKVCGKKRGVKNFRSGEKGG